MSFSLPQHDEPTQVDWLNKKVVSIGYGEVSPRGWRRGNRTWGRLIPGVWLCLTDKPHRAIPHIAIARTKTAMADIEMIGKSDPWYQMTKEKWEDLNAKERLALWNVAVSQRRIGWSLMPWEDLSEVLQTSSNVAMAPDGSLSWQDPPGDSDTQYENDFDPTDPASIDFETWAEYEEKEAERRALCARVYGSESPGIEKGGLQR